MNVLFFMIPKEKVEYLNEDYSLRQAIEKLDYHNFTAMPVINNEGKYVKTISEGDLLHEIKNNDLNLKRAEDILVKNINAKRNIEAMSINTSIYDLIDKLLSQNFIPIVDDFNTFIGIVTRQEVMKYYEQKRP